MEKCVTDMLVLDRKLFRTLTAPEQFYPFSRFLLIKKGYERGPKELEKHVEMKGGWEVGGGENECFEYL